MIKSMQQRSPYMLVVEDSDEDFEALSRIMSKSCECTVPVARCVDGDEALAFLSGDRTEENDTLPGLPDLILLDLNLPGTDGRDVLRYVKQDKDLKVIPVVVFTTSSDPKDVDACYQSGANSYLLKPMNIDHLKRSVCLLLNYWFEITVLPMLPS